MEDFELIWKCKQCGSCCQLFDIYIKNVLPKLKTLFPNENFELPPLENEKCIYLHNNKCDIYTQRPLICNNRKIYELISKISNLTIEELFQQQEQSCVKCREIVSKRKI